MSSLVDDSESKRKDDVCNESMIKGAFDGEQALVTSTAALSDERIMAESIADTESNETEVLIESSVRSLSISDSDVTMDYMTVSGLNVLPESIPVSKSGELAAICESDSSSELIPSTDALLLKPTDDPLSTKKQMKSISEVLANKDDPDKTIKCAADTEQDMVSQSLPRTESLPEFEKAATLKQVIEIASSPVSKQRHVTQLNTPLDISGASKLNSKPNVIPVPDTESRLILDSESSSELKTVSECSAEIASIIPSKETVDPESSIMLEVVTSSESNIEQSIVSALDTVLQLVPDSESTSTLRTTSVPEQCIKFASIEVLEENVELESVTELNEVHTGFSPALEPNMLLQPGIEINSVLVSEATPVYEAIAVLQQDVTLKENKELESDDVIEIIAGSDPYKSCVSELHTISESIPTAEILSEAALSEENVEFLQTSISEVTTNEESATAIEIADASGTFFEPRSLKIANETVIIPTDSATSGRDRRFCIFVDISSFDKTNLSINIIGDKVDICGLQKSENGDEYHEVHQIHAIPEFVDDNDLIAHIQDNGMLLIEAPMKKKQGKIPVTEL